jgi:hypothetical protein
VAGIEDAAVHDDKHTLPGVPGRDALDGRDDALPQVFLALAAALSNTQACWWACHCQFAWNRSQQALARGDELDDAPVRSLPWIAFSKLVREEELAMFHSMAAVVAPTGVCLAPAASLRHQI